MDNLFDIKGKVALITGGSRGIGEMIAEGFVKQGVKTYISSRKKEQCDNTAMRLSKFGHCLLYTSPSPRDKRQSRMPSSA